MASVTPLARGPLSYVEMMVLGSIPLTSITTTDTIVLGTGLDPANVESALAHLCRRGLVNRADDHIWLAVTRPPNKRSVRRRDRPPGHPTPTIPAA